MGVTHILSIVCSRLENNQTQLKYILLSIDYTFRYYNLSTVIYRKNNVNICNLLPAWLSNVLSISN